MVFHLTILSMAKQILVDIVLSGYKTGNISICGSGTLRWTMMWYTLALCMLIGYNNLYVSLVNINGLRALNIVDIFRINFRKYKIKAHASGSRL